MAADDQPDFRWQALFQHALEPLFLLNRRRQVLFVNRAWEKLTGLVAADVRGQTCKLSLAADVPGAPILGAMTPPPEIQGGRPCVLRRRPVPEAAWWDVSFFPLRDARGVLGVLGKITVEPLGDVPRVPLLPEKLLALRQQFVSQFDLLQLSSPLPNMQRVLEQARLAAQTRAPVLIVGPSGAGKHWLARAIHQQSGERDQPFLRLDCGHLGPSILARLLSEPAARTLYLHHPADLPAQLQDRLAQQFVDNSPAARIFAGHVLGSEKEGLPSSPLFYRLSTLTITMPPLRERLDDLPELARRFIRRACEGLHRPEVALASQALQTLRAHSWPGNLRELYEVLSRACFRATGPRLEVEDLPFYLRAEPALATPNLPLDALLETVEKKLLALGMRFAQGNKTRAAEILSIWRPRLIRRLETLGLEKPAPESADDSPP